MQNHYVDFEKYPGFFLFVTILKFKGLINCVQLYLEGDETFEYQQH